MILIYFKNNITEEPKIKMTALEIDGLKEIWVFSALLWKEYRRKPFSSYFVFIASVSNTSISMIEAYKFIQKSKLSKLDQVYRIFINTHNIMYNVDFIPSRLARHKAVAVGRREHVSSLPRCQPSAISDS
jgi:hypothetical protein